VRTSAHNWPTWATPTECAANSRCARTSISHFTWPDAAARRAVLERLQLVGRENDPVRLLSQGQRRRLALARVLLNRRPLWLLDEPHAGLDAGGEAVLEACLAEHAQGGGLAVVATHRADSGDALDLDELNDATRSDPDRPA
jgi:ABC-type transport system involved in cytochrome c biogenesis ATPase subunit